MAGINWMLFPNLYILVGFGVFHREKKPALAYAIPDLKANGKL